MIYKWLKHNISAQNVIVFFNGWGLDENVVNHLASDEHTDVLFVSDYTTLETDLPDLERYENRALIAWSFGVANYTVWQQRRPDLFDIKVAINGTPDGVDNRNGIASKIVQTTIKTLNVDSFVEFSHRCYNATSPIHTETDIDLAAKKLELQSIADRNYSVNGNVHWDVVWLSTKDRIFPTKNQQRAWQNHQAKLIDAAHAPFDLWNNWHELLSIRSAG